jgi:D-alanyl-D-alanine dipeptidase
LDTPFFRIAFQRRGAILGALQPLARAIVLLLLLLGMFNASAADPADPRAAAWARFNGDPAALPLAYPADLHVVSSPAAYRAEARADGSCRMVDLAQAVPSLVLEIRYATSDNFTGRALYPAPRAFARAPVAAGLRAAEMELSAHGLGLKVYDAYRPYSVTCLMWEVRVSERPFLAPPTLGSNHNRGTAVDVTLVDLKTGRELPMPTPFDAVTPAAHHGYMNLPAEAIANRDLLAEVMERHGFRRFDLEWWHYGLRGGAAYSPLDLPFSAFAP